MPRSAVFVLIGMGVVVVVALVTGIYNNEGAVVYPVDQPSGVAGAAEKPRSIEDRSIELVQQYPCLGSDLINVMKVGFVTASYTGTYVEPKGWASVYDGSVLLGRCERGHECRKVLFGFVERDTYKEIHFFVDVTAGRVESLNQEAHTWLTLCRE